MTPYTGLVEFEAIRQSVGQFERRTCDRTDRTGIGARGDNYSSGDSKEWVGTSEQANAPLLSQIGGVQSDQLFELHVLDPEVLDQVGEDALDDRGLSLLVLGPDLVCFGGGWQHERGLRTASDSIVFHPADILRDDRRPQRKGAMRVNAVPTDGDVRRGWRTAGR